MGRRPSQPKEAPVHHAIPTTESIISLEGVFDGVAARHLEERLLRAMPGDRILVDVTQVREFHDFGVAVLGRALTLCRAEVKLRGLRQHQVRVLRYFGVDTGPLERAVLPEGI
jgi:anti-anti-sigma regulatory factor